MASQETPARYALKNPNEWRPRLSFAVKNKSVEQVKKDYEVKVAVKEATEQGNIAKDVLEEAIKWQKQVERDGEDDLAKFREQEEVEDSSTDEEELERLQEEEERKK